MINELSEKLLAEGYTKDNHPPYVRWDSGWKWFEYTITAACGLTWETPCGLLRKGKTMDACGWGCVNGGLHMPENNNLRIGCPYFDEVDCRHRDSNAMDGNNCIVHITDRLYDYEQSVEKILDEWSKIQHTSYMKAVGGSGNCACVKWDRRKRKHLKQLDSFKCVTMKCKNKICKITNKQRNLKRTNVFYDIVRIFRYRKKNEIQAFEEKSIEKGIKVFDSPISLSDAEIWVKQYGRKMKPRENRDDRIKLHFCEYHGKDGWDDYSWAKYEMTVQNMRIEYREARDLIQDLKDAEAGYEVIHASDVAKRKKEIKQENKVKREEAKKRKSEKHNIKIWNRILNEGIDPDGEPASEVIRKWAERELSKRNLLDVQTEVQLTLLDNL